MLGGVPVPVDLVDGDSYRLDADAFRARVTDRTRMIILTHPNNPTTTVFTRSDLEALAALIVEKNLILIVDQAFEDHIFGDAEFVSPATLTGLWDRTVSVFSVSKGYGLSGLRIGYLVSNDAFTKVYNQYAVNVLGAPSTLSQIGAKAAIDDEEILSRTFDQLDRRRRAVTELFASVPGVRLSPIESGFFAWLDVSALGTGREIEDYVLEHANVAITDGSMFGVHGTGFVRVIYGAYAADDKAMQICARIASCLIELGREKGISEDAA
jgi:aspartate/methionine/tyrosine aminotransferase